MELSYIISLSTSADYNFDWLDAMIDGKRYQAKTHGDDVWNIRRVFHRADPRVLEPAEEDRVRAVMRVLLRDNEARIFAKAQPNLNELEQKP